MSLADVYDALTAKRVYKPAFSHEKAMEMILHGECGAFNPLLLECLEESQEQLKKELNVISLGNAADREIHNLVAHTLKTDGTDVSNRTVRLLEHERTRANILSELSREITFEYSEAPEMIKLSEWSADYLGLPLTVIEPKDSDLGKVIFKPKDFENLLNSLKNSKPDSPAVTAKYMLNIKGAKTWCKITAKAMW